MVFAHLLKPLLSYKQARRAEKRAAQCQGKKSYTTYAKAEGEMRYLRRKLNAKDSQRVYHCTYCNAFHIGTN